MKHKKWILLILVIILLLSACKKKTTEDVEQTIASKNTEQQSKEQEKTDKSSAGILDDDNVEENKEVIENQKTNTVTETKPVTQQTIPKESNEKEQEDFPKEIPSQNTAPNGVQPSQGDANVMDPPQNNSSGTL